MSLENSDEEEEALCSITDLPILRVEAPSGWNRRRRGTIATPSEAMNDETSMVDSLAAFRSGVAVPKMPNGFNAQRRKSSMSFNEWLDLKKFQEAHAAREAAMKEGKNKNKNDKRLSITFEDWSKSVEQRNLHELAKQAAIRQKEERERYEREKEKFKKHISFENWKREKEEKIQEGRRSRSNSIQQDEIELQEKKKKSEEEYRKWLLKKELDEIQKEKNKLVEIQNKRNKTKPGSARKGRRGSWLDTNSAVKVAANR